MIFRAVLRQVLSLQDIYDMPAEKRRKHNCSKKYKVRKGAREYTRDELIEYLRCNGFDSSRKLEDGRRDGDPNVYDYRKAFGSWGNAKEVVFGREEEKAPADAEYIAKLLVEFGVSSCEQYKSCRKLRPDIFPSFRQLMKQWGSFKNVQNCVKKYSIKEQINEYLVLSRKLGKIPTMYECKEFGVHIRESIDHFGGKAEMDGYLKELRKMEYRYEE
jgi:hypothetical protein